MDWLYISYLAALFSSAIISILLTVMLWRRQAAPGALPLIILMGAAAGWSLGSALQLMSHSLQAQLFWLKLQYPGIVTLPIAWIVFAFQYTGRSHQLKRRTYILLVLVPTLSALLALTNSLHHIMWTQVIHEPSAPMAGLNITYNWGFWVHAIYAYGLIVWGTYLIVRHFLTVSEQQRKHVFPILIALIIPLLLNLIHVFKLSPFTDLDLTPVAFTITGVFLAIGLRRLWLFDLIPVARSAVIDGMQDGLFVMDPRSRIVDVNPAASSIIGLPAADIIGKPADQIFAVWPNLLAAMNESRAGSSAIAMEEITTGEGANRRSYELRFSLLEDREGNPNGLVLVWSDITSHKLAAEALQSSQQRYRQSVEKSPNPIFSVNREGKIQTWNSACELVFQHGQEILNQDFHTILHTTDEYATLDGMLERVFQERASYSDIDTIYRCKDDSWRYMVSRLFPVIDRSGTVETCVFANTDITERKQADEALRRRLEELTVLHATATACVEAASEDELIERVSKIIGESLYTDNFGILMKNEDTGALHFHPSYHGLPEEYKNTILAKGQGITGQVAVSGEPRRVSDVTRSPAYKHINARTRSELCVPIKTGDRTIGVVNAESLQPNAFSEADERVLNTIAGQLATAIKRLRAETAERQRADELLTVTRVSREITSKLDRQEVLDSIARHAVEVSGSDASGIFTHRPNGRFYLVATHGVAEGFATTVNAQGVPQEGSAVGRAVSELHPVQIPDVHEDPNYSIKPLAELENIRAILALPLISGKNPIGGIVLWHRHPYRFSSNEIVYLEALAQLSVNAIENARLFEETQRRLSELTLLSEVIALTASAEDLHTALNQVCTEVAQFFQAQQAGFALLNADNTSAEVIAEYRAAGRPSAFGLQIPVAGNPSMAYILEHKDPLAISDAQSNPLLEPVHEIMRQRGVASILLTPILLGDRVAGTLGIDKLEPQEFTQADILLMQDVSRQIGQALERLHLYSAAREHAEQMAQLAILSEDLNRSSTPDEVIAGIGSGAMRLGKAERAAIYSLEGGTRTTCPWYQGLSADYIHKILAKAEDIPGTQLFQHPERLLLGDIKTLPKDSIVRNLTADEIYRAAGFWPLAYEGNVLAVVACYYDQPQAWSENQEEVMQAFTRQAVVALQNARLFEETRRRAAQQEAINAIIAAAVTAPNIETLLRTALDLTLQALQVKAGGIWVPGHQLVQGELPTGNSEITRSMNLDIPTTLAVSDWRTLDYKDAETAYLEHIVSYDLAAYLIVPVMVDGRRIGGMSMASTQPRTWLTEEIAMVEAVGRQIGSAVERINLLAITQEQALQMQQIMDTVPEGVMLLNAERKIVLANPAAREYLSILADNKNPGEQLSILAGQPVEEMLEQLAAGSWHELGTGSGDCKIFEIAARRLDNHRQDDGWVLVIRDVTQERENQTRIQMQERLATVGQLAAGIAHDFNNIMAAIVVYTDLLTMEPNLSPASSERLITIQQQVQRATSLIRQILDFSRRSVMEQSSLDLLPFIKELDKLLARVLPENIRMELAYKPGTYAVQADPTRLQQAFMNLALNARDAMPSGGILRFILGRLHLSVDEVSSYPDLSPGNWIRIEVTDTGCGIPPDVIPHIFDPFFTTKPVGQGTGLGLAQVYGIIKQHRGSIDVQSQIGRGTCFIIYLPELEKLEEESETFEAFTGASGSGKTILVVEDDPDARVAFQALLEAQNYRVLTAANGVEALEIYNHSRNVIAAVVSDLVMPKMSGIPLYQALRMTDSEVKMLFVTGHPLESNNQAILEEGQVHWLQKPFSAREFTQVLQELLTESD